MKVSGSSRQGVNEEQINSSPQIPVLLLSCLARGGCTCFLFFSPSFLLASAHMGGCVEDMPGVVVGGQTAKFKHSKSLQPADSSEGSERVEGLREVCVCI